MSSRPITSTTTVDNSYHLPCACYVPGNEPHACTLVLLFIPHNNLYGRYYHDAHVIEKEGEAE